MSQRRACTRSRTRIEGFVTDFLRRLLKLHLELVDEVEGELADPD
jgi:hypothetical protein